MSSLTQVVTDTPVESGLVMIILVFHILTQIADKIGDPVWAEGSNDLDIITPAVAKPTSVVASSSTTSLAPAKPASSMQTSGVAYYSQPPPSIQPCC